MIPWLLLLAVACIDCALAQVAERMVPVKYRQRGGANHIGCAEGALEPFEHFLLPRVLHCSPTLCSDKGSIALAVERMQCSSEDVCSVQVFCKTRLTDVYTGIGITVAGFVLVLAFACAKGPRQVAAVLGSSKLHAT